MNPYKILQIARDASQQEIVQAVALALQRKDYSVRQVAEAQKTLMDPRARKVAEFIYLLDSQRWAQGLSLPKERLSLDHLELIHCFDKF